MFFVVIFRLELFDVNKWYFGLFFTIMVSWTLFEEIVIYEAFSQTDGSEQ